MKGERPTPSVHADLFRPVEETYRNPDMARRWGTILRVRKLVTKALELARKEKTIGHSLNASVTVGLSPDLMKDLDPYKDQLRFIFIVSAVDLVPLAQVEGGVESEETPGVRVAVTPCEDTKCERCWIHDSTVGAETEHPGICNRCLEALKEMGYPAR
jgi:isoleucyl-tRNA synthetase